MHSVSSYYELQAVIDIPAKRFPWFTDSGPFPNGMSRVVAINAIQNPILSQCHEAYRGMGYAGCWLQHWEVTSS